MHQQIKGNRLKIWSFKSLWENYKLYLPFLLRKYVNYLKYLKKF